MSFTISYILIFSFIGMKSQEIPVGPREVINVVLEEDIIGLDEVLIVAYGTSLKKSFTGSAGVLNTENIVKTC